MQTKHPADFRQPHTLSGKHLFDFGHRARLLLNRGRGIHDDGTARALPDGHIGAGIACVIKTTATKTCFECAGFVIAAQIVMAVAGHHLLENTQMSGDRMGD